MTGLPANIRDAVKHFHVEQALNAIVATLFAIIAARVALAFLP